MTVPASLGVRLARIGLTLAILALAGLQIALTWEFWGSFGEDHDGQRAVFQGIGAALSIIEALTLVIAGDLAHRKKTAKALLAVAVFLPTFLVNLGSDVSALALYSARDTEVRGRAVLAYQQNDYTIAHADQRIAELQAQLTAEGLNRPSAALAAERDGLADRIRRREEAGRVVLERSRRELAELQSAHALAVEIETLAAARARAQAANAAVGNAPHASHPQFETIAALLTAMGMQTGPEGVRLWLAFAIGVAVKLWLAFGLFLASDRAVREPAPANQASEVPQSVGREDDQPADVSRPTDGPASQRKPMNREVLDLLDGLETGRA